MKKRITIIIAAWMVFALVAACSSDTVNASRDMRWYSYDSGLIAARESGKKVFLYFQAKW